MLTKPEAVVDDLAKIEQKAEIVNGEIVLMSPTGGLPGLAGFEICSSLREYSHKTRSGKAIPDNVGFIVNLPHRKSFSPDAAYHIGPITMSFITGAPLFAVEVRSESDYGPAAERAMADKRADYFAAGTKAVWDVDLEGDVVVRLFIAQDPDKPSEFRRGDIAHAVPVLPGWTMKVDDLLLVT